MPSFSQQVSEEKSGKDMVLSNSLNNLSQVQEVDERFETQESSIIQWGNNNIYEQPNQTRSNNYRVQQAKNILSRLHKVLVKCLSNKVVNKVMKIVFLVCANLLGLWVIQKVKTTLLKNIPAQCIKNKIKYLLRTVLTIIAAQKTQKLICAQV